MSLLFLVEVFSRIYRSTLSEVLFDIFLNNDFGFDFDFFIALVFLKKLVHKSDKMSIQFFFPRAQLNSLNL